MGGKKGTRERLIYGARIKFVRQKQPLRSSAHTAIYYVMLYIIICKVHRAANVRSRPVYIMYISVVSIIILCLWFSSTVLFLQIDTFAVRFRGNSKTTDSVSKLLQL